MQSKNEPGIKQQRLQLSHVWACSLFSLIYQNRCRNRLSSNPPILMRLEKGFIGIHTLCLFIKFKLQLFSRWWKMQSFAHSFHGESSSPRSLSSASFHGCASRCLSRCLLTFSSWLCCPELEGRKCSGLGFTAKGEKKPSYFPWVGLLPGFCLAQDSYLYCSSALSTWRI